VPAARTHERGKRANKRKALRAQFRAKYGDNWFKNSKAKSEYEISAIHDEGGYRHVRQALSRQYDLSAREPNIQVWNVNLRGDRSLTLRHTQYQGRPLADDTQEVLKHVARLWGFGVQIESADADGNHSVLLHQVPASAT
jgi:spore cortex formation protein SpoVR/YcgB (stage V sporulation)